MSPESKVIRAFVAIRLPEEIRTRLTEVQGELKQVLPRNSTAWTKPDNIHLTLRFLGNVPLERIAELSERLRTALTGFSELELNCERLGCFPDLRYPRVIWAWAHDATERLQELHHRVNNAVREFAEKPAEKQFTGHVTLARPKQIKRPEAEQLARFVKSAVDRQFGNWRANDVVLMRSELSSDGAKYEALSRASLA